MTWVASLYATLWGKVLIGIAFFATGALAGWLVDGNQAPPAIQNVREESSEYKFISPLLFIKIPESELPEFKSIKQAMADYISSPETEKKTNDISAYYRDLDSSQWVGINPDEKFSAASMLKVATLISVLRAAESNSALLRTKVLVAPGNNTERRTQDYYPPQDPVTVGNVYSVQELLNHLIIQSDNTANHVLYQLVGTDIIQRTYSDLEIPTTTSSTEEEINTAREYSHLFRTLYNGTYLSRTLSEKVLDLLSRTTFVDGVVAGVPKGVVVSHKFGQRNLFSSDDAVAADIPNSRELHDCGIVYYPGHPYFLCVMTRGSDYQILANVIQGLSKVVWGEVDGLYRAFKK